MICNLDLFLATSHYTFLSVWFCCIVNFVSLFLQVEIVMALEEQFSITLDEDGAKKIITVQDVVDVIKIVKNVRWKNYVRSHCGLYWSSFDEVIL